MPLYDIRCEAGHQFERVIPLADFDAEIVCTCGARAFRLISTPMFTVDHTGYSCPVTGKWIGSKAQHRENLARTGSRVLETGEKELNEKRRAEVDAQLEKSIEDTVEKTIDSWDSAKKETLHNELVNGKLDLAVERG